MEVMKRHIWTLIIVLSASVLVVCGFGWIALSESPPDAEQVAKFVAAVWKDKPDSIDATVYRTITRPAKPNQQIREMVEYVFAKERSRILQKYEPNSHARTIMLDKLNRTIEMNVERLIKEQKTPRRMKMRIRISDGRERHDIAYADTPDGLLGPNTPYESSNVDLGKRASGEIRAFEYDHDKKEATIHTGGWAASHIEDFGGLPSTLSLGCKLSLGKKGSAKPLVPDQDKIREVEHTGILFDPIRLAIGPDPNFPAARDRIEVKNPDSPGGTVLVCDRADYSRVHSIRSYQHKTGRLLRVRECSNFDSQGFPHDVTVIEYGVDGKLKNKEVYRFEKVVLNPEISNEVFDFRPPDGYKVQGISTKKPETKKPAP